MNTFNIYLQININIILYNKLMMLISIYQQLLNSLMLDIYNILICMIYTTNQDEKYLMNIKELLTFFIYGAVAAMI